MAAITYSNADLDRRYGAGEWRLRLWEEDRETVVTSRGVKERARAGAALYLRGRLLGKVVCDARDESRRGASGSRRGESLMAWAKEDARRELIACAMAGEYAFEEAEARGRWLAMLRARPGETLGQMLFMAAVFAFGAFVVAFGMAFIVWVPFYYVFDIDVGWARWVLSWPDYIKDL